MPELSKLKLTKDQGNESQPKYKDLLALHADLRTFESGATRYPAEEVFYWKLTIDELEPANPSFGLTTSAKFANEWREIAGKEMKGPYGRTGLERELCADVDQYVEQKCEGWERNGVYTANLLPELYKLMPRQPNVRLWHFAIDDDILLRLGPEFQNEPVGKTYCKEAASKCLRLGWRESYHSPTFVPFNRVQPEIKGDNKEKGDDNWWDLNRKSTKNLIAALEKADELVQEGLLGFDDGD
ncbi:hypothetical protein N0V90_004800 [Kalmusia sp. IMI 367209]|nr:hypothetical protein N0V90_004800 [Kalmusia sp. IMI 367209]